MTPQQAIDVLRKAVEFEISALGEPQAFEARLHTLQNALAMTADCAPAPTEPAVDRDAVEVLRSFWMGYCWKGVSKAECEEIYAAFAYLATPASPAMPASRDHLLKIIAFAYQIAGWHDAPEHILAVLAHPESATAAQVDAMLPYQVGGGRAVPTTPAHECIVREGDALTCTACGISTAASELGLLAIDAQPSEFHVKVELSLPQVAQASQPTSAEELQQDKPMPPVAAPVSQQDITEAAAFEACVQGEWDPFSDAFRVFLPGNMFLGAVWTPTPEQLEAGRCRRGNK
jgi:hypothetical protein